MVVPLDICNRGEAGGGAGLFPKAGAETNGSLAKGRAFTSIEFLADVLVVDAMELVLLNMPRGVLEGRSATSLVIVPRAGL
jgi:hypothetical protein